MGPENDVSRRKLIAGAAVGLAAASSGSASASPAASPGALVDPTSKFPKPPFEAQTQPWPGLASKMTPKPDHGETS